MSELELELLSLEKYYSQRKQRNVLRFLIIGFFIGRNLDKMICELETKISDQMDKYISKSCKIVEEVAKSGTYLIFAQKQKHLFDLKAIIQAIKLCEERQLFNKQKVVETKQSIESCMDFIINYNAKFVEERKIVYHHLWNTGGFFLDDEQQTAIVTDDTKNLVVAAAGSGKTEVLTTRIAYLTKREPDKVPLDRILALAYTNKAIEVIKDRLKKRNNIYTANVKNFHKLGIDILKKSGVKVCVFKQKYEWIDTYFEREIVAYPVFYELFLNYMRTVHDKDSEKDQIDKDASLEYAKDRSYFSLNATPVKSKAEKAIMDFLLEHKINGKPISVHYEDKFQDFEPDFHLTEYELYIEHWGINEKGEVPSFFKQTTKTYRDNMEKKKQSLAENNKILVETFSHQYNKDNPEEFLNLLKNRIKKALQERYGGTFEFTPKTYEEILDVVWSSQKTPIEDLVKFITTAKTYNLNSDDVAQRLKEGSWTAKLITFGKLALHVFDAYQMHLQQIGKVDFEDMINKSIEALNNNKNLYYDVYDHILIDEFQDISTQRYNLIKTLLNRNPNCKLFCVGDDW